MPHSNTLCYEFGPFKFNVRERVLSREESVISLGEKATELLQFLLQNAGELVSKEELMKAVWPDSFVEESNLTQNIFTLRRALGDDRISARYIETVPRRGYRFVVPVKPVEIGAPEREAGDKVLTSDGRSPILAVIPFINATGNTGLEYLADGVSDNILNSLSQISKLRVMSRSSVFRYKGKEIEPKTLSRDLRVDALLLGKIISRPTGLTIGAELVDGNGWLLWTESFDCELNDILEIQDEIARKISAALRLKLTGEEEKRITTRYTESSRAYQAYMEGRFHWSRYTHSEIEKAIGHFRDAIEIDPNYALAYAGIVDCYLRLVTNYLPPEDYMSFDLGDNDLTTKDDQSFDSSLAVSDTRDSKVKLRHEWDWKGAEREIRRANELKTDYPAAHQWHAAYLLVRQLYRRNQPANGDDKGRRRIIEDDRMPSHISRTKLTPSEQVQVFCTIAREQLAVGNVEGARLVLEAWTPENGWPKTDKLNSHTAADLLFTLGTLTGYLSTTGLLNRGQKRAESFLNGSIALLEQVGRKVRAAESRIELARCYYRQGLFDEARDILLLALIDLPDDESELRSLCLVLFGAVERDSGRLKESLIRLREAEHLETTGQLVTGRCHHEMAITLKELAIAESRNDYYSQAGAHFQRALFECEAIGNHRHAAAVENNLGYLLLHLKLFNECEIHLMRALELFQSFSDSVRAAQVQETLAQLYLVVNNFAEAQTVISTAVATLEMSYGEALLAEALITKAIVACRQGRYSEARTNFEGASRVAERCGDYEGVRRSLVTMFEEIGNDLDSDENLELGRRLKRLLSHSQQSSLNLRTEEVLARIEANELSRRKRNDNEIDRRIK